MPLLNKKQFERNQVPHGIAPNTKVFYLEVSNEIFTNYDEFFDRTVALNSTQWSCEFTGKTGLTYFEALQSEHEAMKALDDFPMYLRTPILYIIKNYVCRGRFDDVLNDISSFLKDRYFIGEECMFQEDGTKRIAKVLDCHVNSEKTQINGEMPKKDAIIPAVESYRYKVKIIEETKVEDDDGVREYLSSRSFSRNKHLVSKPKLKLFLKHFCYLNGARYEVKEKYLKDSSLDTLTWDEIIGGPEPLFPKTPILQRGRQSKVPVNGQTTPDTKASGKRKSAGGRGMSEKKKQKINMQQEELAGLFETAKKLSVDISNYEQNDRVLSNTEINKLKEIVKVAKEQDRESAKEQKKLKLKAKFEWNRKRDDLECDDLKPFPNLPAVEIPNYISDEDFSEFLTILQFFNGFLEFLPVKEIRGSSTISLHDIVIAIRCKDPNRSPYCDLMKILLIARSEAADEEDGNEAEIENREEMQLIQLQNCDPIHPIYGDEIREMTRLHRLLRKTHGDPVRHLPVDWMTISEVLRLIILTSGYYTGSATHRHRLFARGNYHGYEDPGFQFRYEHPDVMEKLKTGSVFDLNPKERLDLMQMVISQLLTYHKFRTLQDERISQLYDTKREWKKLRTWDQTQEFDAHQAQLVCEYELEKEGAEKPRASGAETTRLKSHLKALRDSRRSDKDEFDQIVLAGVEYAELNLQDILTAREYQKEKVKEAEDKLLTAIFDLSSACGQVYLGRDRAFRNYFIIDRLPGILIENPTEMDHIGSCSKATPLQERNNTMSEVAQIQSVLGCTGTMSTCSVHGAVASKRPRWSHITTIEMLDEVIGVCNPRGFRECELTEELTYFRPRIIEVLNRLNNRINMDAYCLNTLTTAGDPATYKSAIVFEEEMKEILLDLEDKLNRGLVGELPSDIDREAWRKQLEETGDIADTIKEDMYLRDELIYSLSDTENEEKNTIVRSLALAFLQLIQGVDMKYFRAPFTNPSQSEPGTVNASKCFVNWQKGLLQCESVSALFLFLSTIEPAILWDKSRLQGKCATCRKKADAENLVLCVDCNKCFHPVCVKLSAAAPIPKAWTCFDCTTTRKKKLAVEKRKATREAAILASSQRNGSEDGNEDWENDGEAIDITRTSSGRTVKRVTYKENYLPHSTPPFNSRRQSKSNMSYDSIDEEEDESGLSRNSKRKREEPIRDASFRTLSTGLREQDSNSKEKMVRLEQTIRAAMKQDYAWPFLEPVNAKEVPDYYDIIRKPIDLRTMMNKIKNRCYDSPEDVREDLSLLISNCKLYNEEGSEIFECAVQLDGFFDDNIKELFDNKRVKRR
ncbi:unnamed protein product [Auanema sp. JU1783]|nr:unnamed protein product [Auanema sp. JU1783]